MTKDFNVYYLIYIYYDLNNIIRYDQRLIIIKKYDIDLF